jgi:hypothetical protein
MAILMLYYLLTGCTDCVERIGVRIPDFDSAGVEGVSLWRLGESGSFEPVHAVYLSRTEDEAGHELVVFPLVLPEGDATLGISSEVTRDPRDPDSADLTLYFRIDEPGRYRLRTFNAAGVSPLSTGSARF